LIALFVLPINASAQGCGGDAVFVQILGSGGPRINPDRADASYLLWIDGRARLLVDAGGGAFFRFGQSEAKLGDLSMVAITHLHPDHVSDLPALLWLSQTIRKEPLPISGPSGNSAAPEFSEFLRRLFDEKNGAFPLLGPTLGGAPGELGGGVRLDVNVVDVSKASPSTVFDQQGIRVTALGIPHGPMPTLAYRVETAGRSVVFSSDQTGTDPKFAQFAKGANALIMHLAIGAGSTSPLHAPPSVVGQVARDAGAKQLILSHISIPSVALDPAIADVKKFYAGPLTIGRDLQCTPVS
jgi:ribonuclease BN (tRNA processing enzyme)